MRWIYGILFTYNFKMDDPFYLDVIAVSSKRICELGMHCIVAVE